ncbi:division/cell wall cluster transcriptional repressor MraZ [Arenimonas composti]|uniref:Transcriptional regulator MraZ n=1 Tax=Arenimonas composti TR7-09 = DSM 18010 TaxID=1121013 RepID=A0A091BHR0_9GAMM|nr:division/cell wall cluster transcriptional repressor MraZ [Arenimonas composti]KFN51291.1 hypothetical protein P873_03220 [Arenimonas composti TR7-09 = DSM 18010]
MFQGETAITIDDKGRMAVPTAYRDVVARECGNRLVFTYNPYDAGGVWLFPHAVWERVRDKVLKLSSVHDSNRRAQRLLVGAAAVVEPDAHGRVLVPASMRTACNLEKKAVLLGMGEKFELWSEQAHLAQIRRTIAPDELSPEMLELDL